MVVVLVGVMRMMSLGEGGRERCGEQQPA